MRKFIFPFVGSVGVFLAACLAAPAEPAGTSNSALTCASSERAFNGACRKVCAASADCSAPNTCMTVSAGVSLCIDYKSCAYLGGDTECTGVPYASYGYGYGYGSSDPSWTPSYGPYASPYSGYIAGPFACGGNAVWHAAPPAASDDPKCGETHAVVRCQKVGNKCSLVTGTTMDVAER